MKHFNTLIVGGGQAGLSVSYYLSLENISHLVLERADIPAPMWRDDRWDSFTLVTPNWDFKLPGGCYAGSDPDGFMPKDEIVKTFSDYVKKNNLPVKFGCEVKEVVSDPLGFRILTNEETYTAANVVIATGLFQFPRHHEMSKHLAGDILQMHSGAYRNSSELPEGAVLVVGSSQSGCQIADELNTLGRNVYLCVGYHDRAPRRYRGKDIFEWMHLAGIAEQTTASLASPKMRFSSNPIMAGRKNGGSLNVHQLARNGVSLLGSLKGINGRVITIETNLHENLLGTDQRESDLLSKVDSLIKLKGLDSPEETIQKLDDGYACALIDELNLDDAQIKTVIWATGYDFSFDIVKFPVFDEDRYPIQQRGVTEHPGLYFIGLPWLYNKSSGLLSGVGKDAENVAMHIKAR